jgi:hypothetical protein
MMMLQMQMQEVHNDKALKKDAKEARLKALEGQASELSETIQGAWAASGALRAMQLVLRAKRDLAKEQDAWSKVHEFDDDFDEIGAIDAFAQHSSEERRSPPPPRRPPKKKGKPKSCKDAGGPWPCDEAGCPKPMVGCEDLHGDCKRRFKSVFSVAPEGLGEVRVWQQCKRTCDRCDEAGGRIEGGALSQTDTTAHMCLYF